MNYSTLDKFQGAWLGGIVGSALSDNFDGSDCHKILNHKFQDWIEIRNKVAKVAIDNRQSIVAYRQLTKVLLENQLNNFLSNFQDSANNANNNVTIFKQLPRADSIDYYCRSISVLLPLIILQFDFEEIGNLYAKTIVGSDSNSTLAASIQQDILAWSYIVTMALNNRFPLEKANVSQAIAKVLSVIKAKPSSLVEKLEIVSQAWKNGLTLQQLTTKLHQHESSAAAAIPTASLAIALSFYCFASTPRNFMLSTKRATKIDSKLSTSIALLTATISGAYNGRTGISRNWLRAANYHRSDRLARETVKKLYQNWLGVYKSNNFKLLCNLGDSTVATPRIFQTRQNLKIVSQNFDLD